MGTKCHNLHNFLLLKASRVTQGNAAASPAVLMAPFVDHYIGNSSHVLRLHLQLPIIYVRSGQSVASGCTRQVREGTGSVAADKSEAKQQFRQGKGIRRAPGPDTGLWHTCQKGCPPLICVIKSAEEFRESRGGGQKFQIAFE